MAQQISDTTDMNVNDLTNLISLILKQLTIQMMIQQVIQAKI